VRYSRAQSLRCRAKQYAENKAVCAERSSVRRAKYYAQSRRLAETAQNRHFWKRRRRLHGGAISRQGGLQALQGDKRQRGHALPGEAAKVASQRGSAAGGVAKLNVCRANTSSFQAGQCSLQPSAAAQDGDLWRIRWFAPVRSACTTRHLPSASVAPRAPMARQPTLHSSKNATECMCACMCAWITSQSEAFVLVSLACNLENLPLATITTISTDPCPCKRRPKPLMPALGRRWRSGSSP
jgi:hypothetical protein